MTTIRRAIPVIEKLFLIALAAIVLAVFVYVILARHAHADNVISCPNGVFVDGKCGPLAGSGNGLIVNATTLTTEPDYTLIIRTKLKQTILVRGIRGGISGGTCVLGGNCISSTSKRPKDACEDVATTLWRSSDIDSAECFQ